MRRRQRARSPECSAFSHHALAGLALLALGGCTPVGMAIGAASTAGVTAAQDGGIGGGIEDTRIRLNVSDALLRTDRETWDRTSLIVWDKRVLMMGKLTQSSKRGPAVAAAQQVRGVQEVIDEYRIGDGKRGLDGAARDYAISTQIRTALALDRDIDALNIALETHDGTVYLIGSARNPQEIRRILDHARAIRYVSGVVSYVRVRPPKPPAPRTAAPEPVANPGSDR